MTTTGKREARFTVIPPGRHRARSAAAPSTSARASLAGRVSRGVTKGAQSEVVRMALGETAAAIDAATLLLHTGRDYSTAEVSSGRKITEAEALRARRDMVYAHQVGSAVDRLCEMDGARWVYDNDELGSTRSDVMTILTHHAASRQAAMAPYGRLLLSPDGKRPSAQRTARRQPQDYRQPDFFGGECCLNAPPRQSTGF